jgi:hypothetical protein
VKNETNTSRLRPREIQEAFFSTLRSYARLQEFNVLAAVVNDDTAPPNYTFAPGSISIEFKADLERITERTLQGDKPSQAAWFALIADEPVPPAVARDVVMRCGTAYAEAGLHRYFEPKIRRGRGESRAAA